MAEEQSDTAPRTDSSAGTRRAKASASRAKPAAARPPRTAKPAGRTRKAPSAKAAPPILSQVAEAVEKPVAAAAKATATAGRSAAKTARKAVDEVATATASGAAVAGHAAASVAKSAGKTARKAADEVATATTSRTAAFLGVAAASLVTGFAANIGRKAVVQAPSVMAGDWLKALKAEHALALALFDKLQKTTSGQPAKRAVLLTQLKHALGKHAFTEENVIYPALRDWGDKADADKLNHDHGYVKQYLYDLDGMDNAAPEFLRKVASFRADLEAHIREEEDSIFPPLHAALSEEANARLTALANKEGFKLA